jgi:LVIVD repeat
MRGLARLFALVVFAIASLAFPITAWAGHENDPRTGNVVPRGHVFEPRVLGGALFDPINQPDGDIHTDIAFRGNLAFQGNWDGFSIRDISSPDNPQPVSRTFCDGNQGDVVVMGNVLVRSWNSPAGAGAPPFGTGLTCDGVDVPAGFEGLHVFDISNLANPVLVKQVPTPCGSHTATAVPDPDNSNRLLIYNSASSGVAGCQGFGIVDVPLNNPAGAQFLRQEDPTGGACHDIGVILGDAMRAVCAGGTGFAVWSLGGARGGSLTDPERLYRVAVPTVTIGHSGVFSWDGKVVVFGHEPGGGVAAECEETDSAEKKSYFFYDTETGTQLGRWTLPRSQGATENCTLHNPNTVPISTGRDVLVAGAYQAGTWVVDFTDPANATTVGWSDPPPKPVPPNTIFCCDVTGSWSSFWYDGFIYESNIGEGLNIFGLRNISGLPEVPANAIRLGHSNPNTQEFSLPK